MLKSNLLMIPFMGPNQASNNARVLSIVFYGPFLTLEKLRQIPYILWVSDFHKKWTHGIKWIEHPTRSKIQNAKTEDANEYIQAFSDTQASE